MSALTDFKQFLSENEVDYKEITESSLLVDMEGDENVETVSCSITFSETADDETLVIISYYDLPEIPGGEIPTLRACSRANDDGMYAKFYIDEDGDTVASYSQVYPSFSSLALYKVVLTFADDVDVAFGFFREARRSGL